MQPAKTQAVEKKPEAPKATAAVAEALTQVEEVDAGESAEPVEPAVSEPAPVVDDADTLTYTVKEGEDLADVSIRWGVSAAAVRELNNLGENDKLKAGQVLRLPADAQQN